MPKAAPTSNISRRALLLAGAGGATAGFGITASLADERDTNLFRLLAEFDRAGSKILALRAVGADDLAAEARLLRRVALVEAKQEGLFGPICAAEARTMRGVQARARSLVLWQPELLLEDHCRGWTEHLTRALLRDLVALPA